jgi:2-polyprenyl-3-methyl-5-hydroxy-6-metoxy-1,4-benzoquinol methylase
VGCIIRVAQSEFIATTTFHSSQSMTTQSPRYLYTQKANLYQRFFVDFLKWEKVLGSFFKANDYLFSGIKVLDAGCGTGSVTRVLYDLAHQQGIDEIRFHGFDLTPAMLDLFRRWMDEEKVQDIQLQQANVLALDNQLPQDWQDYDVVVSSALLEYIPKEKLSLALGNLRQLLNQKGRLLVFVTKRTWIAKWTGAKWWGTNLYDPDEVEDYLRQAGFSNIQFKKLPDRWNGFMLAVEAQPD